MNEFIKLLEHKGEIMYWFKNKGCRHPQCGQKPSFDGWHRSYTPPSSEGMGGLCFKHLMEINMESGWGPNWKEVILKFLRENPDLCLEL